MRQLIKSTVKGVGVEKNKPNNGKEEEERGGGVEEEGHKASQGQTIVYNYTYY